MISSYGFDAEDSFLLSMPGGAVQLCLGLGIPYLAGRYKQRMLGAIAGNLFGLFGICLMAGLASNGPLNYTVGQLIGYYFVIASGSVVLIMILSIVASDFGMSNLEWELASG
jgi:hypothetical protein